MVRAPIPSSAWSSVAMAMTSCCSIPVGSAQTCSRLVWCARAAGAEGTVPASLSSSAIIRITSSSSTSSSLHSPAPSFSLFFILRFDSAPCARSCTCRPDSAATRSERRLYRGSGTDLGRICSSGSAQLDPESRSLCLTVSQWRGVARLPTAGSGPFPA
ncbi:hypothetical protein MHYP_G00100910 [Metynnis hypsauchen]